MSPWHKRALISVSYMGGKWHKQPRKRIKKKIFFPLLKEHNFFWMNTNKNALRKTNVGNVAIPGHSPILLCQTCFRPDWHTLSDLSFQVSVPFHTLFPLPAVPFFLFSNHQKYKKRYSIYFSFILWSTKQLRTEVEDRGYA